jgi:hypothetical protein
VVTASGAVERVDFILQSIRVGSSDPRRLWLNDAEPDGDLTKKLFVSRMTIRGVTLATSSDEKAKR